MLLVKKVGLTPAKSPPKSLPPHLPLTQSLTPYLPLFTEIIGANTIDQDIDFIVNICVNFPCKDSIKMLYNILEILMLLSQMSMAKKNLKIYKGLICVLVITTQIILHTLHSVCMCV